MTPRQRNRECRTSKECPLQRSTHDEDAEEEEEEDEGTDIDGTSREGLITPVVVHPSDDLLEFGRYILHIC